MDNASTPLSLNEDVGYEAHPTITSSTQNLLPNKHKMHNELYEDMLLKSWWSRAKAFALQYQVKHNSEWSLHGQMTATF